MNAAQLSQLLPHDEIVVSEAEFEHYRRTAEALNVPLAWRRDGPYWIGARFNENARQVIIACSATKRPDPAPLPAFARYDGPAWRTYRARKSCAQLPGFALSAEHGLISEYQEIPAYERELDTAGARRIFGQVAATLHRARRTGLLAPRIFVFGSSHYRALIQRAAPIAGIAPDRLIYSTGGIGQQLGQLAAYLEGE